MYKYYIKWANGRKSALSKDNHPSQPGFERRLLAARKRTGWDQRQTMLQTGIKSLESVAAVFPATSALATSALSHLTLFCTRCLLAAAEHFCGRQLHPSFALWRAMYSDYSIQQREVSFSCFLTKVGKPKNKTNKLKPLTHSASFASDKFLFPLKTKSWVQYCELYLAYVNSLK